MARISIFRKDVKSAAVVVVPTLYPLHGPPEEVKKFVEDITLEDKYIFPQLAV